MEKFLKRIEKIERKIEKGKVTKDKAFEVLKGIRVDAEDTLGEGSRECQNIIYDLVELSDLARETLD